MGILKARVCVCAWTAGGTGLNDVAKVWGDDWNHD